VKPLIERSEQNGLLHHQALPVRTYSEDAIQKIRVSKSLGCCVDAMCQLPAMKHVKIIELGCGAADICGPLSEMNHYATVFGVDCNERALAQAAVRYPRLMVRLSSIQPVLLGEYDLVILCEVLEHLADPNAVAAGALNCGNLSVISHPLDEAIGSMLSGGDHAWTFSMDDHLNFFALGGHAVDHTEVFQMGLYKIVLSRGHRVRGDQTHESGS
jgi:hypothetical protein